MLVSGLDNLEEALWYINGILDNKSIRSLLSGTDYKYLIISEENYDQLLKGLTVEAYETFYRDNIANQKKKQGPKVELIGDEKALEEIAATQKVEAKEGDDLNKAKQTVKPQSETPKSETPKSEEKETPKKEEPVTQEKAQQKQPEDKKEVKPEEKKEEKKETKQEDKKEEKKDVKQEEKKQEEKKEIKPEEKKGVKQEEKKEDKPAPETVKTEPVASAPQPAKELTKYKGLFTYDVEAPHYFVIVLPGGGANFGNVRDAIEKYNLTSQSLLNLRVTPESGRSLPQLFVAGVIPDAQVAQSYLLQVVKDEGIKASLQGVDYRNIVISKDNLNTLKQSGNLTVYMEFFKQFYLK